jgi:predicted O-methyltransferase YrrM
MHRAPCITSYVAVSKGGRFSETTTDKDDIVNRLSQVLTETHTPCFAWALLSNHLHLLLRTGNAPIVTIMRKTNGFIKNICAILILVIIILFSNLSIQNGIGKELQGKAALNEKVRMFLDSRRGAWHDWNIPYSDGKLLHDIILKNRYTKAIEIGTSTGHSAIWIAWALSKTGGKLITIEIDEGRYKKAMANFKEAGLSDYIDARLADAHVLVEELPGPFDFVFSDADKDWYTNYFRALAPKLEIGGCFTAHNVRRTSTGGIREFIEYVKNLNNFKTSIDTSSRAGMSISFKISEN